MAKKKSKRKVCAKALERKKLKKIKDFKEHGLPHHNKAYVDPSLQKQAGVHGEQKKCEKHKRRKGKAELKKSIQQKTYDE